MTWSALLHCQGCRDWGVQSTAPTLGLCCHNEDLCWASILLWKWSSLSLWTIGFGSFLSCTLHYFLFLFISIKAHKTLTFYEPQRLMTALSFLVLHYQSLPPFHLCSLSLVHFSITLFPLLLLLPCAVWSCSSLWSKHSVLEFFSSLCQKQRDRGNKDPTVVCHK